MRQALICFYCHLFANVRQQQCSEVTEVVRNYRQKMPWAWHWFFSAWTHKISWTRHKGYQTTGANVCDFVCPALFVFFMLKSAMKHKQTAFGQMRSSQSTRHNIKSHVINSFLTVFDTASLYSVKHCLLLPAVLRVSVKHWVCLHDVTLTNSLFDSAVIVQYEEVPITTPLWCHPLNSPSGLALIVAYCLFRPTNWAPIELGSCPAVVCVLWVAHSLSHEHALLCTLWGWWMFQLFSTPAPIHTSRAHTNTSITSWHSSS